MIISNSKNIKLVCDECGQGDFGWSYGRSMLFCHFCKKLTRWVTEVVYKKKKEREHHGNRLATYR